MMKNRASFREYKGKQVFYVNYSGLKDEQLFLEAIDRISVFRKANIENKLHGSQLLLVNTMDAYIFGEVFKKMKKVGVETAPFLKKQAIVGISGGKRTFLNLYNLFTKREMKAFVTEEDALEWLVTE